MDEQLREKMIQEYKSGKSLPEVAKIVGRSESGVRYHIKNAGLLRGQADAVRLAAKQGKIGRTGKRPPFSKEHCENISKGRQAWAEENARGVTYKSNGYVEYTRGENKFRCVHVIKMEERLGRRLLDDESVHHIDGNRSNNDENNLALVTRSGHARLHRIQEIKTGNERERNKENGQFC